MGVSARERLSSNFTAFPCVCFHYLSLCVYHCLSVPKTVRRCQQSSPARGLPATADGREQEESEGRSLLSRGDGEEEEEEQEEEEKEEAAAGGQAGSRQACSSGGSSASSAAP